MITIWNKHKDEYLRLSHFVGENQEYVGEQFPNAQYLIMPEGPWIHSVPQNKRKNIILYLCVEPKHYNHFKSLGFKFAFVKDTKAKNAWGQNSIVLPPLFSGFNENTNKTDLCCSVIHNYKQRCPAGHEITTSLNIPNYGLPDNPCYDVPSLLNKTKFLVHIKTVGYLCNVVLKAMVALSPIIFTKESYQFGYEDYLKHNENCFIANNKQEITNFLQTDGEKYKNMQENIKKQILKTMSTYDHVKKETISFMKVAFSS